MRHKADWTIVFISDRSPFIHSRIIVRVAQISGKCAGLGMKIMCGSSSGSPILRASVEIPTLKRVVNFVTCDGWYC